MAMRGLASPRWRSPAGLARRRSPPCCARCAYHRAGGHLVGGGRPHARRAAWPGVGEHARVADERPGDHRNAHAAAGEIVAQAEREPAQPELGGRVDADRGRWRLPRERGDEDEMALAALGALPGASSRAMSIGDSRFTRSARWSSSGREALELAGAGKPRVGDQAVRPRPASLDQPLGGSVRAEIGRGRRGASPGSEPRARSARRPSGRSGSRWRRARPARPPRSPGPMPPVAPVSSTVLPFGSTLSVHPGRGG